MRAKDAYAMIEEARRFGIEIGRALGRIEGRLEQAETQRRQAQGDTLENLLFGGPLLGLSDCGNPKCPIHGERQPDDDFGNLLLKFFRDPTSLNEEGEEVGGPVDSAPIGNKISELDPVFDPDERV